MAESRRLIMQLKHNKCRPGYTRRKGYVRKDGVRVKGSCVKSTAKKTASRGNCPVGKIMRHSYTRVVNKKNGTRKLVRVKATCVKDMGKPGKLAPGAPSIGPLKKGELSRFGYSYKNPEQVRRRAIAVAIKELGSLNLYRKLDAVAKLTTLTSPKASQTFASDRDWIRTHYVLS